MKRTVWVATAVILAIIAGFSYLRMDAGELAADDGRTAELHFQEADDGFRYGVPLDPSRIAKTYKSLETEQGRFFLYSDRYKEGIFAGAEVHGQAYVLTMAGYADNLEIVDLTESRLFGRPSVVVRGYCGASCPTADYLSIEDGYPFVWLHVEASVQEYDLDSDGNKELIATAGTPLETAIYRMKDGKLQRASVNEALSALSVSFFQDGRFIAYEPDSSLTRTYRYQEGFLTTKN